MDDLTRRLATLSSAEDFLEFFALPFDEAVVHVNRLHILKRFYQYLRTEQGVAEGEPAVVYARYRGLLQRAYEDFVRSTPAQEKVFKVFQEADGQRVSVDSLRATLPSVA
jgi:nitrogenase-stabilizing/protective protein